MKTFFERDCRSKIWSKSHRRVRCCFVLETIRTGANGASFTSLWRPKWRRDCALTLYCTVLSVHSTWKSNEITSVGNKTVKCSMPILKASRSAIIAEAFLSTRPTKETLFKDPYSSRNHRIQAAAPSPILLLAPIKSQHNMTWFLHFTVEIRRRPLRSRTIITIVHQPICMCPQLCLTRERYLAWLIQGKIPLSLVSFEVLFRETVRVILLCQFVHLYALLLGPAN